MSSSINVIERQKEFGFEWSIKYFTKDFGEEGKCIFSDAITLGPTENKSTWRLSLYSKGDREENKNAVGLFLNLKNSVALNISVNYTFAIICSQGKEHFMRTDSHTFKSLTGYGFPAFIKRDVLFTRAEEFLPNNVLTIKCTIKIIPNEKNIFIPKSKCIEELGSLFLDKNLSDFVIRIGDREIPTHKAILSARSTVFAAMFKHDMIEATGKSLEIKDFDYDVVLEMLRFIYSEKVKNLEVLAFELLKAADKYNLAKLKKTCENFILQNTKIETALDTLVIADLCSSVELKDFTIDYIIQNIVAVMDLEAWDSFASQHPKLNTLISKKLVDELIKIKQKEENQELK